YTTLFRSRIIRRSRTKRHVKNGGTLVAGGGHAGAIGDEHVLTVVQLVPLVEEGCSWVAPHAHAAHFVDVEAGRLFGIGRRYIRTAGFLQHFRRLGEKILNHFVFVVGVVYRSDEQGDAPGVVLIGT